MRYIVAIALLFGASMGQSDETETVNTPNVLAPGRADRMFEKRAGKDFGTFEIDCKGGEGACNNACFYIRCIAPRAGVVNPARVTYIGPKGNNGEDTRNRIASGCSAGGFSPCGEFPFSQKFSEKTAGPREYQCDEWPPAMSQQLPFGDPNRKAPNSLRCMFHSENESIGSKLGNFATNNGMVRDDYFKVDFEKKIASADQSKVKFCLPLLDCGQDGKQIELTEKKVGNGKITSYYNRNGDDNKYSLSNVKYKDLFQCGVSFTREGDQTIKEIVLDDWENKDHKPLRTCTLAKNGDTCLLRGLPNVLQVKRTGNFGTKLEFEYEPGKAGVNVNNFAWDSDMSGNGRGPWTDPESDPNRQPLRYCKVVPGSAQNTQKFTCWFPCYRNADGM